MTEEIDGRYGEEIADSLRQHGLHEGAAVTGDILEREAGRLSMESTEQDIVRELQVRMSLAQVLEKKRSAVIEAPVREQFENDLRALTEAEQDSKELKSAKQHLLYERIIDGVQLPFPIGPDTAGDAVVKDSLTKHYVKKAAEAIYKDLVRKKIAVDKRRPDGRSETEIRAISCEVTVSPRTHGSGLFTRGQTQIMSLLTLGTAKEGQRIDDLSLEKDRRFMHHYNFPPFSVGETGRMTGPRRRDIGHGALAQRALEAEPSGRGRLPVHDPHRLRDARVERLVVDGLGLRLDARADGRRRADQGAGLRHRDGPRQGGRRLRHPHRHPGRRGSPRRHGLQGRRHARGHHRAPDGHQDHGRLARDHGAGARAGEGGPRRDPRPHARGDRRSRAPSSPATRRASRPSRSTPSTSAW